MANATRNKQKLSRLCLDWLFSENFDDFHFKKLILYWAVRNAHALVTNKSQLFRLSETAKIRREMGLRKSTKFSLILCKKNSFLEFIFVARKSAEVSLFFELEYLVISAHFRGWKINWIQLGLLHRKFIILLGLKISWNQLLFQQRKWAEITWYSSQENELNWNDFLATKMSCNKSGIQLIFWAINRA